MNSEAQSLSGGSNENPVIVSLLKASEPINKGQLTLQKVQYDGDRHRLRLTTLGKDFQAFGGTLATDFLMQAGQLTRFFCW